MTPRTASSGDIAEADARDELEVALPQPETSLEQDAEWCVARVGDEWQRVRFHDYERLFSVPGLYEKVIYDVLRCRSPQIVSGLLLRAMDEAGESPRRLRVLDLGAGNGMVGELLVTQGAEQIVGVDIIEEAAEATARDRPGVYDHYRVVDLTELTSRERRELVGFQLNCLTCVAALGFGDIPTEAFTTAFNLIQADGWIAFNIKEEFLDREDASGFARLVRTMLGTGVLDVRCQHRYPHRLGVDRKPIHYVAVVGRKKRNVPNPPVGDGRAGQRRTA